MLREHWVLSEFAFKAHDPNANQCMSYEHEIVYNAHNYFQLTVSNVNRVNRNGCNMIDKTFVSMFTVELCNKQNVRIVNTNISTNRKYNELVKWYKSPFNAIQTIIYNRIQLEAVTNISDPLKVSTVTYTHAYDFWMLKLSTKGCWMVEWWMMNCDIAIKKWN